MWHSQNLGPFEAKNIICVFLHRNSFLGIKITKDIFPDDKKYKKVPKMYYLEGISTMWATPYLIKSMN